MEIQITAIKFETVNCKKTGKSLSFKLDPKKMAQSKTEAALRKKIEEYVAKSGVFKRDELKDLKYKMKDFLEEWRKQLPIVEAEEMTKYEALPNNPASRTTPERITRLAANEVKLDNVTLPNEFWDILGSPEVTSKYDLERFIEAQAKDYDTALQELTRGHKRSHWIWYIFPQQKGLGHSYNSNFYGLDGADEAKAYLAHPILGERLRECCEALLLHKGKDIEEIMGSAIDVLKLQTSMNLFNRVSPNDIFKKVLDTFF